MAGDLPMSTSSNYHPRGTQCFHLVSMLYPLIPKYSHLTPLTYTFLGMYRIEVSSKQTGVILVALSGLMCTPLAEGTELKITSALPGG